MVSNKVQKHNINYVELCQCDFLSGALDMKYFQRSATNRHNKVNVIPEHFIMWHLVPWFVHKDNKMIWTETVRSTQIRVYVKQNNANRYLAGVR